MHRRLRRPRASASLEGRRLDGLRIVVDSANGAAIGVAARRASHAPAPTSSSSTTQPDGRNINDGCGATDPGAAGRARCVEHGADLGLALDGDADRLIAVDHTGAVVDGDHIIAICARRPARPRRAAATTPSSSP